MIESSRGLGQAGGSEGSTEGRTSAMRAAPQCQQ